MDLKEPIYAGFYRKSPHQQALFKRFYHLIASDNSSAIQERSFEIEDGWLPIVERLLKDIDQVVKRDKLEGFRILQIKEKYGELRVYVNTEIDEIRRLITKAKAEAEVTCENCGQPGELRNKGNWWLTLCLNCDELRKKG